MTLPNLSPERIDQMACFACSCAQEPKHERASLKSWLHRVTRHFQTRPMTYGLGATALSAGCVALALPLFMAMSPAPIQSDEGTDIMISDYMMQDLLESLS